MSVADRAAAAYRTRVFSWNRDNARWGRFATELPAGVREALCGVCGETYDEPKAKAAHLEQEHRAIVRIVEDGSMYEWRR